MKRLAVLIGAILSIALGAFVATAWFGYTAAQEERELDLRLIYYVDDDAFRDMGDACRFPMAGDSPAIAGGKVVVRDETGTIILISDEFWSTLERSDIDGDSDLICTTEVSIPLPEATFYEVFWGDTWMTAYHADDLPLEQPLEVVPGIN